MTETRKETQSELDARLAAEDAAWGPSTQYTPEPEIVSGHSEYLHQENDRENWNI